MATSVMRDSCRLRKVSIVSFHCAIIRDSCVPASTNCSARSRPDSNLCSWDHISGVGADPKEETGRELTSYKGEYRVSLLHLTENLIVWLCDRLLHMTMLSVMTTSRLIAWTHLFFTSGLGGKCRTTNRLPSPVDSRTEAHNYHEWSCCSMAAVINTMTKHYSPAFISNSKKSNLGMSPDTAQSRACSIGLIRIRRTRTLSDDEFDSGQLNPDESSELIQLIRKIYGWVQMSLTRARKMTWRILRLPHLDLNRTIAQHSSSHLILWVP